MGSAKRSGIIGIKIPKLSALRRRVKNITGKCKSRHLNFICFI